MIFDPDRDYTHDEIVRVVLGQVAAPCAAIEVGGVPASTVDSYLSGSPYLPEGSAWPADEHGPQLFVGQVNWAEVPELEWFPTSGLLQWFVSADDTYGLTEGADAGKVGFTVRWWDDLSVPSLLEPGAPPLTGPDADHPLDRADPVRMTFRPGLSLPPWEGLPPEVRELDLWEPWARDNVDELSGLDYRDSSPSLLYELLTRVPRLLPEGTVIGSKVSGFPSFTQQDPRGAASYGEVGREATYLILELDAEQTGGWGDGGIAHLFGRPQDLARGDLSTLRYHWDCS